MEKRIRSRLSRADQIVQIFSTECLLDDRLINHVQFDDLARMGLSNEEAQIFLIDNVEWLDQLFQSIPLNLDSNTVRQSILASGANSKQDLFSNSKV